MTRKEAIHWMTVLKQSKINWIGDTNKIAGIKAECEKAEQEALDMAIEALSAVCDDCIWHVCNYNKVDWGAPSAEAAQGWIPCSERLPNGNEYVLVDDGVDMFVAWYNNGWHTTDHSYDPYTDIIAWTPLPEPYKGGDSE